MNESQWDSRRTSRAIVPIGFVILVCCSGSPQLVTEPTDISAITEVTSTSGGGFEDTLISVTFSGQFVFKGPNGVFSPVQVVHIKRKDEPDSDPERINLAVDAGGYFSTTIELVHCQFYKSRGDRSSLSLDDVIPATLIINARGCKEKVLKVTEKWKSHVIVLSCAGRHEP